MAAEAVGRSPQRPAQPDPCPKEHEAADARDKTRPSGKDSARNSHHTRPLYTVTLYFIASDHEFSGSEERPRECIQDGPFHRLDFIDEKVASLMYELRCALRSRPRAHERLRHAAPSN